MRIYKILPRADWDAAYVVGVYEGSELDRKDGFIHFSTADQLQETASRHFRGQADLVVLELEADDFGEELRWEPSRGGQLFPHLYRVLVQDDVYSVTDAPLDPDGVPLIGPLA